ncbi:MAG TPA: cytochrome c1 [Rhodanobacteraceae bacterium]|nr:cytochrome c1 [Rhodanobacteraceae bacterium]
MIKHTLSVIALVAAAAFALPAIASEGADLPSAQANIRDTASLQRGAALFINYCSGCHSLKYLRYSRMAEDLGLTEQQVMDNLNFTGEKFGDPIVSTMPVADATKWFGKAPPDLSLEVRAKGADWVYNYLRSFYLDPSRPVGWNNTVFPNASMPNVLWSLQGVQVAEHGEHEGAVKLSLAQPGAMTPAEFDGAARDITAFLEYAAEPAALQRRSIGVWVLLYLALFTLLAYFLKREFWKDVH